METTLIHPVYAHWVSPPIFLQIFPSIPYLPYLHSFYLPFYLPSLSPSLCPCLPVSPFLSLFPFFLLSQSTSTSIAQMSPIISGAFILGPPLPVQSAASVLSGLTLHVQAARHQLASHQRPRGWADGGYIPYCTLIPMQCTSFDRAL